MIRVLRRPMIRGREVLDALNEVLGRDGVFTRLTVEDRQFRVFNFQVDCATCSGSELNGRCGNSWSGYLVSVHVEAVDVCRRVESLSLTVVELSVALRQV